MLKRWGRKTWQLTRFPQYKSLWNALNKRIKKRLNCLAARDWSDKLLNIKAPNHEFWSLAKAFIQSEPRKVTRLLHGQGVLVYSAEEKSEVFAEHLEI